MLKKSLRVCAALGLLAGLALVPTAAGNSPTPPPYPLATYYIPGPAGSGTATPIQHLVVLFQENVSYDHYFGTYPNATNPAGEPAFHALPNTPSSNNYLSNSSLLTNNPNKDSHGNTVNPYRLDRSQAVTCDQDHGYGNEQKAFDGNASGSTAAMDDFVKVGNAHNSGCTQLPAGTTDQGAETMGYFDGNTVTGMWNLAQHFAMSDNSFGTTFGPSTPGALNLVAGQTSNGSTPLNTAGSPGFAIAHNAFINDADPYADACSSANQAGFTTSAGAGTGPLNIGDVLSQNNITWGWFQGGFRPTSTGPVTCGAHHTNLAGRTINDYNAHHSAFQYFPTTENTQHLSPTNPDQIGENDSADATGINHQYDESDFYTALQANHLPAVTFLKGANYQDGHAGFTESDPLEEQTFVSDVVNAVEQSPSWQSTAIVIMYDDSDGWYDHAFHSIVNPSSDSANDFLNSSGSNTGTACGTGGQNGALSGPLGTWQDRCGPGPRLPLLVISPWAKQNYIDHTFTDQSSVIKFIEENWGVGGLGGGAFESMSGLKSDGTQNAPGSANPGDLMSMFDFNPNDERAPAVFLNDQTGEVASIPQGPSGSNGSDGSNGSNGSNGSQGPQGPNGSNGSNGGQGPQGPAGPQGPKGNPGATPHVLCHVKVKGHKITVTCVEVGSRARKASRNRARAKLLNGRRVLASGSGHVSRINMTARGRVRHGIYMLKVTVPGAAIDDQVIRL